MESIRNDPAREVYVAHESPPGAAPVPTSIVGFVVIVMHGAFVGYIQSVAVREDARGGALARP